MYEISTYAQVVEKALAVESIRNEKKSAREHGTQIVVSPLIRASKNERWKKIYPICTRCKRRHLGECRARSCFACGMVGHFKRDFPSRGTEREQRGIPTQVFISWQSESETETSSSGMTGQFSSSEF